MHATSALLWNATINASMTDVTRGHLARRYTVLIINKLLPVWENGEFYEVPT